MIPMLDYQLLREYARERSERAFAEIVDRYAGIVYWAAMRQTRNRHSAEDITQQVFAILARKAEQVSGVKVLSAWLLTTTRYVCSNWMKMEARRNKHERNAAAS